MKAPQILLDMAGKYQISRSFLYPYFTPPKKTPVFLWKEKYEKKEEMQIQVKCSCGEGNCQEWAIVEVQGVVEVQPSFKDQIQNLEIGRLCRSSSQEIYTFTIGYHELSGSKISLKKPLLVMRKKKFMVENNSSDEHKINPNSLRVELEVIGIIRHKILFKTRPKALISKPQSQVKENKKVVAPSPSIQ